MAAPNPDGPKRRGWKRFVPRDPWQIILGPVIVAVVGAGLAVLTRDHAPKKAAALMALTPVVVNPESQFAAATMKSGPEKGQQASRLTDRSKPRVEIRLHNTGTRRAVLTSALFTVRRFSMIPGCGRGAGLEVSVRYDVTLPDRAGSSVEVPINQQLGPDEADRFAFRLTAAHVESRHAGQDLFYELDVNVRHDSAPAPLHVGRVVVAIPGAPMMGDAQYFSIPGQSTCSTTPPKQQLAATTFTGVRSPELDRFLRALRSAGRRSQT